MMTQINIEKLIADYPLVQKLIDLKQVAWFNPGVTTTEAGLPYVGLTLEDVKDAQARLSRFAPYLMEAFPETQVMQGIIESEAVAI
ncbi:TPA: D-serine dehydratase, partial [Klebsiella pneumoniae]|nr:D-serine dehydratase [Klebsiella pneumoniae]